MDAMVSAKISFHTQGPEKIQNPIVVHGNAVVHLYDFLYNEQEYREYKNESNNIKAS